ncbi:winged helix-turn-helix domain-containing protein [Georgenia yuyongxinii]|uniref:Winged helix-turn-helix domain-containing protein n=1 Tax=Georgenia yuyongxinii TaxID=2589797 RepID=A0A5B8C7V4_9MICO|nr:crosslink repair DNA glycosylase YcaQ family protein [Georgenia yuyongxinii]QDC25531.1 winged helix-turn-helix domain-containing protein [Georgenia yuyongxinii]
MSVTTPLRRVPRARRAPRTLTPGQARRIAVAAQGLDRPRPAGPVTISHLQRVVDRIALLQIDSVNVVARAHLLPLFSRLGPYDPALVDRASGRSPRRLVEFWAHEASYIPPATFQLLRWRMEGYRQRDHWGRERDHTPVVLEAVREFVASSGPVTATEVHAALGHARGEKEHWGWNWTPAKHALEHLFNIGEIAAAGRTPQFERAYDLTARVLPPAVLATPVPDPDEAVRQLVTISARAHGVATLRCLADYFRLPTATTAAAVADLVEDGTLEPVHVRGWKDAYLAADARLPRRVPARALLAPFDPLVFERRRLQALWGMHYRIGIYTPAAQRTHGYYPLPFLLGEHLVARVDVKADRQAGLLRVRAVHSEEPDGVPGLVRTGAGTWPGRGEVATGLAAELAEMARWLGLGEMVVDDDAGGDLPDDLTAALTLR